MVAIVKISSLIAIIYLVITFVYPLFKPMSAKRKKRSREFIFKEKEQKRREKYLYFKDIILRRLSTRMLLNDIKREELNFIINRLDLRVTPEEIRLMQILYVLGAVAASMIVMRIMPLLGYICLIFIVLGWIYPVDELEKKNRKEKPKHT